MDMTACVQAKVYMSVCVTVCVCICMCVGLYTYLLCCAKLLQWW